MHPTFSTTGRAIPKPGDHEIQHRKRPRCICIYYSGDVKDQPKVCGEAWGITIEPGSKVNGWGSWGVGRLGVVEGSSSKGRGEIPGRKESKRVEQTVRNFSEDTNLYHPDLSTQGHGLSAPLASSCTSRPHSTHSALSPITFTSFEAGSSDRRAFYRISFFRFMRLSGKTCTCRMDSRYIF